MTEAKIENLRMHDLRRTFGSYQASLGSSLAIIGKSLGHKSHSSTSVCACFSEDSVEESIEKTSDFMVSIKGNI